MTLLRVGTRSSTLALVQTELVTTQLRKMYEDLDFDIVKIQTTGDILYDIPLTEVGGKALFLKEIEEALLTNKIDIAVHSAKDVPASLLSGLTIPCYLAREDARDAFISLKYDSLLAMPPGAKLGTCSSRRKALAQRTNPNINVVDLRGNVTTRIEKLQNNLVDAVILAVAGLQRLGLEQKIKEILDPNIFIPAIGQGAVCVECRADDNRIIELLTSINHHETAIKVNTEREFLKAIEGDCKTPAGIYSEILEDIISIKCFTMFEGNYEEYQDSAPITRHLELGRRAGLELRSLSALLTL